MRKVSVIIPVYNTEKYLEKCLNSILRQTLDDIEILCINDCSSDCSLSILNKYADRDKRIRIINFMENRGVSIARNKGIEEAGGEYLSFIDSDDYISLDFLENLYLKAQETQADIVKGKILCFDQNAICRDMTRNYDINDKIKNNPRQFLYGFTSAIYKRTLFTDKTIRFPENIIHFEDPYFSILMTLVTQNIQLTDNATYYYFRHQESSSSNCKTTEKAISFVKVINLILDKINATTLSESDYQIYLSFLTDQLLPWCYDLESNISVNQIACSGLSDLIKKSKNHLTLWPFFHQLRNIRSNTKIPLVQEVNENKNEHALLGDYYQTLIQKYVVPTLKQSKGEDIYCISVVNNYDLYNKFFIQNPFIHNLSNIHPVNFDNTQENIGISKRYNSFLNQYDYTQEGWFLFCHNDWQVMTDLNDVLRDLDKNNLYGPIGACFNYYNGKAIKSIRGACFERRRDSSGFRCIQGDLPMFSQVDTFDCQALIVHSSLVKKYNLQFDEKLDWDLYVEDFCINAQRKHNIKSYTVDLPCCHWSGYHTTPFSYVKSHEYLNQKYPDAFYSGVLSPLGGKQIQMMTDKEVMLYALNKYLKKNKK